MTVLAEPPRANGVEFTLDGCSGRGDKAMYCVCTATATGAWERVTEEDATTILGESHPDLRGFRDAWQRKVIGA
jgi:hypothetical protein